ncbi:hypothetical protein [Bartonella rattaustraliani]|uniref:hypothetical protein n=1 Tax=Bartonella rattaustraliani TaxID=481139 RepID=UPI000377E429|nr:hypothetical protein [Bartonella rattaustraliani]
MTDFKAYSNFDFHDGERSFLKKISYSMKESAFIGSLNGCMSGVIAAILATYGYIALPGFGPIIVMGLGTAFVFGVIIGTIIGLIIGFFVGIFCILWEVCTHHNR